MEILDALQTIGLNVKQAKVYLAVLKLGTATAFAIADKSELKRPTTYVILNELIQKNIVNRVPRSRKQLYRARAVEEVFSEAEHRMNQAKEKVHVIKALAKQEQVKPKIIYFEGMHGIKEALNYRLKEMSGKEFIGFYAKAPEKEIAEKFDEYNHKLKQLRIKTRAIAPQDSSLEDYRSTDKEFGRSFKTISPAEYQSDIAVIIGDSFTTFFDPKNMQSVVIDNKDITTTMRQVFEMVWKKV